MWVLPKFVLRRAAQESKSIPLLASIRTCGFQYYIYSTRFAKPGGPDEEDLPDFLQDGFHDLWFRFIMNVSFRLSFYLDFWSHFM